MEMKSGYYWVRRTFSSDWIIVQYDEDSGLFYVDNVEYTSDSFYEIDVNPAIHI